MRVRVSGPLLLPLPVTRSSQHNGPEISRGQKETDARWRSMVLITHSKRGKTATDLQIGAEGLIVILDQQETGIEGSAHIEQPQYSATPTATSMSLRMAWVTQSRVYDVADSKSAV